MKKIFIPTLVLIFASAFFPAFSSEDKEKHGPVLNQADAERKAYRESPPRNWQFFIGGSSSKYDVDYRNISDHQPRDASGTPIGLEGNPPAEKSVRPFGPLIGIGRDFGFNSVWGFGVTVKGGFESSGLHLVTENWEMTNESAKFKVKSGDLFLDFNYNFFYKWLHMRPYVGFGYEMGSMELGPVDFEVKTTATGERASASPRYNWTKKDNYKAFKFGAGIKFFNRQGLFSNIRIAYEKRSVSDTEFSGTRDRAALGELDEAAGTRGLRPGTGTFEGDSAEIVLMLGFTF